MIDELTSRVWSNPQFHASVDELGKAWIKQELGLPAENALKDSDVSKAVQAAAILALSRDPQHQNAAYRVAVSAFDLRRHDLPGLAGALRVILTRMGNFPALHTSREVETFERLPTKVAVEAEIRADANSVRANGQEIILTDFQRDLWKELLAGNNVSISAPTSAGKSYVLQHYLRDRATAGALHHACYIVPSRALIAQVSDAISTWRKKEKLSHLSIVNVPPDKSEHLPEPAVFVLTQERLQLLLRTHPGFAPEIIICDEAQNIQDGARGVLLQTVIEEAYSRSPQAQAIFAGPNISNLSVFANAFGASDVKEVYSRNTSVAQNLVVVDTRSIIPGRLNLSSLTKEGARRHINTEDIGHPVHSIKERLVRVAERFGARKPSIVYANRPYDAEGVAKGLAEVRKDVHPSAELNALSTFIKDCVHPEYDLARCVEKGVGFHYGRIPALVRRSIEGAFSDGSLQYLVTTSTLIQGVNFPAANLFICQPKKGSKAKLEPAEFWNLAGRAGRLGREFQGNVFLIDYDTWPTQLAHGANEYAIDAYLGKVLADGPEAIINCADDVNPPRETDESAAIEAAFAKLLSDHITGRLDRTLTSLELKPTDKKALVGALERARERIRLPIDVLVNSPTISALRQQRLLAYLEKEIARGGQKRLEQLIPRHPRDPEAFDSLCEVYKICHKQLLSLNAPRLHRRYAAISLKWMRGASLREIIDENHLYEPSKHISSVIRSTLDDIEQKLRFQYLRLTTCYIGILSHLISKYGSTKHLESIPALPMFLEMGAADKTMMSFMSLGLSRYTAQFLSEDIFDKEMSPAQTLDWLFRLDVESLPASRIVRDEVHRIVSNPPALTQRRPKASGGAS